MPRSKAKKADDETTPLTLVPEEGEIVPEGDFAGMRADDVLALTTQGIYEELGELTIEHAGAAIDIVLGEFLDKSASYVGHGFAKECAIQYVETCMPYLRTDLPEEQESAAALGLGGKNETGETDGS